MYFLFPKWREFCERLDGENIHSVTAKDVLSGLIKEKYLILKHDIETNVERAYKMAQIENIYGHKGSYYVQAYLLDNKENISLLQKMQNMGHEITYHYDVLDSCKGDKEKAINEFDKNIDLFEKNGFKIETVCQHGNPIVERVGYTSNRDFFRDTKVQEKYSHMADIMVNFKEAADTNYTYFSDAGRKVTLIYDPVNDDLNDNSDKNISYNSFDDIISYISDGNCIISTHPHRWTKSLFVYLLKMYVFKSVRCIAKVLEKVPILKRIMSRYYYLAKKI